MTKSDLGAEVQIVTTDDEALMFLFRDSFRPIASAETTKIVTNAPTKIMITRLDTNTPCMLYTRLNTRMYAATNILKPAPVHTVLDTDADNQIASNLRTGSLEDTSGGSTPYCEKQGINEP